MALIEEVCMGDVDTVTHAARAAYTPAPRNGRSAAELVMGAYPNLVIYPPLQQADAVPLSGGGLGAPAVPAYQPASSSSPAAASGGENASHHDHSSKPLRRSATWSSPSQRPAGSTWAERRRKLQMSRDVRRGQPKIVKKTTRQPASKASTPAAWFPDPNWEDYAEFRTSGWVQNDKQVDDIAAMLAKW